MNKFVITTIIVAITGVSVIFASPLFYDTELNEPAPNSMMENTIASKSYQGIFMSVNDGIHDVKGDSKILSLNDGSRVLRLENFKSTNGPDLYVYLSTDIQGTDIINLGLLKANIGNQNYEIPNGTNLEKFNKVLIWCKSFSVLFGSAELST